MFMNRQAREAWLGSGLAAHGIPLVMESYLSIYLPFLFSHSFPVCSSSSSFAYPYVTSVLCRVDASDSCGFVRYGMPYYGNRKPIVVGSPTIQYGPPTNL